MFTYDHYINTCLSYRNEGYTFKDLNEDKKGKSIWMVHDCDLFLENALEMALIEAKNDITSTYFIRLGSRSYNVFSKYYSNIVKEIISLGHEIGLHYERIITSDSIEKDINRQTDLFKSIFNKKLVNFNIHEPVREKIDIGKILPEINRCYNSDYFKNVKYISDSGARWREGCFSNHINKHEKILVSTHPTWWCKASPRENY
jgi:hypothetical protein